VNEEALRSLGITHILNVATGIQNGSLSGITYLTVEILDLPETNIVEYFPKMIQFIRDGIAAGGGGGVLVHWYVVALDLVTFIGCCHQLGALLLLLLS